MNMKQLTFLLRGNGPAVLTLPQPMPPETLLELERSLAQALGELKREQRCGAVDPGQIEYASWLEQLGAARH